MPQRTHDEHDYYWCESCQELRIDGTCRCLGERELRLHELLFPIVF